MDMPRSTPYKLMYIQAHQSVTFTKSAGLLSVYSMKTSNKLEQWTLRYSGFSSIKTLYLSPGYYSVKVTLSYGSNTETFSYQSDHYPCPFPSEYHDVHGIFDPCNQLSVDCPPNEVLINGICVCKIPRIRINGICECKPPPLS